MELVVSRNTRLTAELMTPCGVGAALLTSEPFSKSSFIQYNAFGAAGTTTSVISSEVVAQLGFAPISQHAQGQNIVNVYLVDLILPNKLIKGLCDGRIKRRNNL